MAGLGCDDSVEKKDNEGQLVAAATATLPAVQAAQIPQSQKLPVCYPFMLPLSSFLFCSPPVGNNSLLFGCALPQQPITPLLQKLPPSSVATGRRSTTANVGVAGGRRFECPDCSRSYSTFGGLSKHRQFHCTASSSQQKRQLACKHCDKRYSSLGALKMHIRTHTLPCKCQLCGKAFSRPWLLQGHLRTHTGTVPYDLHTYLSQLSHTFDTLLLCVCGDLIVRNGAE